MDTVCFSSIDLCKAQVNALDCDDITQNGVNDVVVTGSFVDLNVVAVPLGIAEQVDPGGQRGKRCARRPASTEVDYYTVTLTLCSRIDAALMSLLNLWDTVVDPVTSEIVGWKVKPTADDATTCGCVPATGGCDPAVSMLFQHIAWDMEERHATHPYVFNALPKVVFDPSSVTTVANTEFQTFTVTGRTYTNAQWGQGPGLVYPEIAGLDRHHAQWASAMTIPNLCDDTCGYAAAGAALGN